MPAKVRDLIPLMERHVPGLVATRGGHRQLEHPIKPARVTVAGMLSDDVAVGTEQSVYKQVGLKK